MGHLFYCYRNAHIFLLYSFKGAGVFQDAVCLDDLVWRRCSCVRDNNWLVLIAIHAKTKLDYLDLSCRYLYRSCGLWVMVKIARGTKSPCILQTMFTPRGSDWSVQDL